MVLEKYIPGTEKKEAGAALAQAMREVDVGVTYADVMRHRIEGRVAELCHDAYYVAREDERILSRLWNGWGKHKDSIGNWGNFFTDEALRGKGIGGQLLRFWHEDFEKEKEKPLCLLCTAANEGLVEVYGRYGFRRAVEGQRYLYKPTGSSPASFEAFCHAYYTPSAVLYHRSASFGYRHEIDCLLRFAFALQGLAFDIGKETGVENALLRTPQRAGMLFAENGHCVGWSVDGQIRIHPVYQEAKIIEQRLGE